MTTKRKDKKNLVVRPRSVPVEDQALPSVPSESTPEPISLSKSAKTTPKYKKLQLACFAIEGKLSLQEVEWVKSYVEDRDIEKASIKSGRDMSDAKAFGTSMMARKEVVRYINIIDEMVQLSYDLTETDVLRIWGKMAISDDVKSTDKLRATELIGKAMGIFKESSVPVTNIQNIIGEDAYTNIMRIGRSRLEADAEGSK